jgi:predicted nucleic acid-binding Zn ribbon protein
MLTHPPTVLYSKQGNQFSFRRIEMMRLCPICETPIEKNKMGKYNFTCSPECRHVLDREKRRQSIKVCPICKNKFLDYDDALVCGGWDCKRAELKCKDWGIPLNKYNDEVRARNTAQKHINMTLGLCQVRIVDMNIRMEGL